MHLKDIQYFCLDFLGVFNEDILWLSSLLFWQNWKSGTHAEDSIADAGVFGDQASCLQMYSSCSYMKRKFIGLQSLRGNHSS